MTTILACPVCGAELSLGPTAASCTNRHTFDRARSGYLNLLLPNRKQSAEPGDSPAMLRSRRTFLDGDFYDPMAEAASTAVAALVAGRPGLHIADLGCGEGFFTARVKTALADAAPNCYGVDISRPGIRMAATRDRDIHWIVASLHRSPFLPRSLDVALSVFAPIDAADVRRIVKDDGALVTVTPGPDHLDALRALLYASVEPHPATPALMAGDTRFEPVSSTRVRYPIVLNSTDEIMNLLAMTPYYWNISRATKARVEAEARIALTVDAFVNVFRPG